MSNNFFTAKKIAIIALFVALSFAVSFLEIPLFDPFKLDFSFAVILLGAYIFGPLTGEFILLASQLLRLPFSHTAGTGEIANFIAGNLFIVLPAIIYKFKKGLPTVIISLTLCSVLEIGSSLLFNRFVTFPMYYKDLASEQFKVQFFIIIVFNLIKCVTNGTITVLLYKRLKNLLNKLFLG